MENSSTARKEENNVVVKLELGHHAVMRSEKSPEGFTHDWTVFVRGPEGISIQHFVDKVVFYLHESFHKPKRVVKEPPYQVSESGYAGFNMQIEVYFKSKEEPKKVRFDYDLYLRVTGPPTNNIRCEKLTFQNPVDDFRRKLIKAGGVTIGGTTVSSDNTGNAATVQTHSTTLAHDKVEHSTTESHKLTSTKISSFRNQERKKHSSTKEAAKHTSTTSRASQPFTDIFGTPIKTKSSPDQVGSLKEGSTGASSQKVTSAHTKPGKVATNLHCNPPPSTTKESKAGRPSKEKLSIEKETKDAKHSKSSKHVEKESKQTKRRSSPSHGQHGSDRKRKRTTSASSENNSVPQRPPPPPQAAEKKGDTVKSKHNKELKVKDKHKSKPTNGLDNDNTLSNGRKEKNKEKSKTPKPAKKLTVAVASNDEVPSPLPQLDQRFCDARSDGTSALPHTVQAKTQVEPLPPPPLAETKEDSEMAIEDLNSSPSSSISLSSLPPGGSHGPLATMMAEMEKDLLSPLSSDPGSPSLSNSPILKDNPDDNYAINFDTNIAQKECTSKLSNEDAAEEPVGKVKQESENATKSKKDDVEQRTKPKKGHHQIVSTKRKKDEPAADGRTKEETTSKPSVKKEKEKCPDNKTPDTKDKNASTQEEQAYVNELIDLQQKIMSLSDRQMVQKVVDVVEETGNYDITSSSFDFDLFRLDQVTVRKLQNCLTVK